MCLTTCHLGAVSDSCHFLVDLCRSFPHAACTKNVAGEPAVSFRHVTPRGSRAHSNRRPRSGCSRRKPVGNLSEPITNRGLQSSRHLDAFSRKLCKAVMADGRTR